MSDQNNLVPDLTGGGKRNQEGDKSINEIIPVISSISAPIVMLIGPVSAGKTIASIRLANYLNTVRRIKVKPNRKFRPDEKYQKICNDLEDLIRTNEIAPERTEEIDFLLIDVYLNEDIFCHILEASGEHFFSTDNPKESNFKTYLNSIFLSENKKIGIFMFESNQFKNDNLQLLYGQRLEQFLSRLNSRKDNAIILYNKVDELTHLTRNGAPNVEPIKRAFFKNHNYIGFINAMGSKRFKRVPFILFSSGVFNEIDGSSKKVWTTGPNSYPKKLWDSIYRSIKPGWFDNLF